ncbi:hypothetical protein CAC42_2986 [Sphaceloma murrayae]|uniref:Elongin-A n=1 Tax=Sphaceloma murrayae TaxID=2082308 RepID=A0A2K1R0B9_9PEZI|nr:hypothetical protein CAC42_2986 [Sphaceloma murrayae]
MASSTGLSESNIMGAPTLVSMSRRTAVKHVDDIMTFADLAPHLLPPIIRKVSSPKQLRDLEIDSPQIVGLPATVEQWKAFIRRDIPNWEKKTLEPKNPALWWKVYRKLKREDEADQKVAEERLKQALGKQAAQKESNKSTILHSVLPEARSSIKHLESGVNRKTVGMDALKALRRQTAHSAMSRSIAHKFKGSVTASRSAQPVRPAHLDMAANRGTVSAAPSKMVQEYARKAGTSSSALPSTASRAVPAATFSRAPRPQMRNPFKSTVAANRSNQEALNLAIKIEKQNELRQAEAARRIAASKAEGASPPAPPTSRPVVTGTSSSALSPEKVKTTSTLSSGRSEEKSRSPQPPVEEMIKASSSASVPAPGKRKAPNIFMAQKKRKLG